MKNEKANAKTETENISTCTAYLHFKIPSSCQAQGVSRCAAEKLLWENQKTDRLTDCRLKTEKNRMGKQMTHK